MNKNCVDKMSRNYMDMFKKSSGSGLSFEENRKIVSHCQRSIDLGSDDKHDSAVRLYFSILPANNIVILPLKVLNKCFEKIKRSRRVFQIASSVWGPMIV